MMTQGRLLQTICFATTAFLPRVSSFARIHQKSLLFSSLYAESQVIHLNHAGASPCPPSVLEKVVDHLELEQKLGGYAAEAEVKKDLAKAYQHVAKLLHAAPDNEVALVESATVAWTRLFYSFVDYQNRAFPPETEKIILVSEAEYAAQVVAAVKYVRDNENWIIRSIPSTKGPDGTSTGVVDVAALEAMLADDNSSVVALVCIAHIPTNSGIVNHAEEIGRIIASHNEGLHFPKTLYLLDACQSLGQVDVHVKAIKCHGLCGTGRKYLRGPRGTGILYAPEEIASQLVPNHVDHHCAPVVRVPSSNGDDIDLEKTLEITFKPGAHRFEYFESSIANKLGLGEAARYATDEVGMARIEEKIRWAATELRTALGRMEKVKLYHGDAENRSGIVTFQVTGMDAVDVKSRFWEEKGGVKYDLSVVPATSTPLDSSRTKIPDLVRASVSYTTSQKDIDGFCDRLESL